jgi:hypothetical protein
MKIRFIFAKNVKQKIFVLGKFVLSVFLNKPRNIGILNLPRYIFSEENFQNLPPRNKIFDFY